MKIENIKNFLYLTKKFKIMIRFYLDSANSSQKPKVVADRINEFYTKQFQMLEEVFTILQLQLPICTKIQIFCSEIY